MATLRSNTPNGKISVLFATFSMWSGGKRLPTNGSVEPLRDYLLPKIKKLVLIDELHPGSEDVNPKIEVYREGDKTYTPFQSPLLVRCMRPILKLTNTNATQVTFKVRDFFTVLLWGISDHETYDYLIGLESVNAIAGILLRRLGKVKRVVYYVSDYSPNRYSGRLFNRIYLALDRYCAMHADYIWDVSKAMQPARILAGLNAALSAPVIHVPNGLLPGQIKANPVSGIKKHSMVYMGTVGSENGPDIAIRALALIKKKYPDTVLHMVGGTEKESTWLRELAVKLNVTTAVVFHGFIPSSIEMSAIIRKCAVGLAPYRNIPGSIRLYADAGKIRAYCASGLPVVSSPVPPLGLDARDAGAAVIADDTPEAFASAVMRIFSKESLYMKLRKNAILFAKNSTWTHTFDTAFRQMR